ncbi:hypothetical protein KI387_036734, partial [Taxus chinensis]
QHHIRSKKPLFHDHVFDPPPEQILRSNKTDKEINGEEILIEINNVIPSAHVTPSVLEKFKNQVNALKSIEDNVYFLLNTNSKTTNPTSITNLQEKVKLLSSQVILLEEKYNNQLAIHRAVLDLLQ